MNDSKEDCNENNPNQNTPSEAENMEMVVDETITDQAEGESSENNTYNIGFNIADNSASNDTGIENDRILPVKLEIITPSTSKDQSNVRITWECKDTEEVFKSVSHNAVLNIPCDTLMHCMRRYFSKEKFTEPTTNKETQTDTIPPSTTFNLQYDYHFSSDFEDSD